MAIKKGGKERRLAQDYLYVYFLLNLLSDFEEARVWGKEKITIHTSPWRPA